MKKILAFIEEKMVPLSVKVGNNTVVKSLQTGIITSLSVVIIGSIFTLFANFPFEPYMNFIQSIGLQEILLIPGEATTDMMAILTTFFTAYTFAKEKGHDPVPAGILALSSFVICTPHYIQVGKESVKALSYNYLGAGSLFVALIIGLSVGALYSVMTKKGWVVKMPDGVPPMVEKSFAPIISGFVIITLALVASTILSHTSFENLHSFISILLQKPLTSIGSSLPFFIIFYLIMNLCWFFGIHGTAVWAPVAAITAAIDLQNLTAYQQGSDLPNMYAKWAMLMKIGGIGSTVGLCFLLAFFAKSTRYKSLGRMCLLPSIFQINEPLVFGMPMMLNPLMFFPLVINPIITGFIAYIGFNSGLVNYAAGLQLPWTTPPLVNAFLQGGVSLLLLQLIILVIVTLMYYPFFKIMDKQEYEKEIGETIND